MKIAIVGRKKDTENYHRYLSCQSFSPIHTLHPGEVAECDGLLLPGGGDITPAFFGQQNRGARNIDTELDILQFQAFDCALRCGIPVLGICKGMQVINVALGGTLEQHMETAAIHIYRDKDQYHNTHTCEGSILSALYGSEILVNSAHHQCVRLPGKGLVPIQWCADDGCIEAISHESLPILGLQWHPERLDPSITPVCGRLLLDLFSDFS